MLKVTFIDLLTNYSNNEALKSTCWIEIEQNYSNKKRHYHNLEHLNNVFNQLLAVKDSIQNWECILFTLYYHDVIYNTLQSDNEEKSAMLAEERMQQIAVPKSAIELCKKHILATKKHKFADESDTNYFTDADLSILGQNWDTYLLYTKNVRKEYTMYPDFLYNPGRKKVLKHFFEMKSIYKTDYFFKNFENQARENLQKELELLN